MLGRPISTASSPAASNDAQTSPPRSSSSKLTSDASGYGAIFYGGVLGTVLALTFRAGLLLLYRFDNRPTDVPMSAITRTIEIELLERLGADEIPPVLEPIDGRYLM